MDKGKSSFYLLCSSICKLFHPLDFFWQKILALVHLSEVSFRLGILKQLYSKGLFSRVSKSECKNYQLPLEDYDVLTLSNVHYQCLMY